MTHNARELLALLRMFRRSAKYLKARLLLPCTEKLLHQTSGSRNHMRVSWVQEKGGHERGTICVSDNSLRKRICGL